MNNLKFLGKLVLTYLGSLVLSLFALFLLMVPMGVALGIRDPSAVVIVGVLIAFFYLGCLCVFIYLPILLLDKREDEVVWQSLIKRYLPFVSPVLAFIFILFVISHSFSDPLGYLYIYIYLVSMISLFVFCRMIVPNKD